MARDLNIKIRVEHEDAERGLQAVEQQLTNVEQAAGKMAEKTGESAEAQKSATTASNTAAAAFERYARQLVVGGAVAGAAALAIRKVADFAFDSVHAYVQAERGQVRLTAAMRAQQMATPGLVSLMADYATELRRTSIMTGGAVVDLQRFLIQAGVMPSRMRPAQQAAADLAAAMDVDLKTAALAVGRAMDGEIGSLRRYGIRISETAFLADGANAVFKALQERFGGAAAAELDSYEGKLARFNNTLDDYQEVVGKIILDGPIAVLAMDQIDEAVQRLQVSTNQGKASWAEWWASVAGIVPGFIGGGVTNVLAIEALEEVARLLNVAADARRRVASMPAPAWLDELRAGGGGADPLNYGLLLPDAFSPKRPRVPRVPNLPDLGADDDFDYAGDAAFMNWLIRRSRPGNMAVPGVGVGTWPGWAPLESTMALPWAPFAGAVPQNRATFGSGPGLFSGFGSMARENLGPIVLGSLMGGGSMGKSIGGLFGGGLFENITGKFSEKFAGSAIGGVLGSVLPGLGTIVGSFAGGGLSKLFGGLFGGGESKKTGQARDEFISQFGGLDKLRETAEEVGFSLDRMLSTKKVKDFDAEVKKLEATMAAHQERVKGVEMAQKGLDLVTQSFASRVATMRAAMDAGQVIPPDDIADVQERFDRLGQVALSTFGAVLGQTKSFLAALDAVGPSLDRLIAAQDSLGLSASGALEKLLDIRQVVQANQDVFQSVEGVKLLIEGLGQAGLLTAEDFTALGQEAAFQLQTLIDRGVDSDKALALMQPTLQALWEAQQKFGFETDEATQKLLDQAKEAGLVGPGMKNIHEQIRDVLLEIKDALQGITGGVQAFGANAVASFRDATGAAMNYNDVVRDMPTGADNAPGVSTGGLILGRGRVLRFSQGGFVPQGTDTVPAMLTPGELVLRREAVARLVRGDWPQTGGGLTVSIGSVSVGGLGGSEEELADRVGRAFVRGLKARGMRFQRAAS